METKLKPYSEYRDGGLDWIGSVPAHWEVGRSGRLFSQRNVKGRPELPILEVSLNTGVRVRNEEDGGRKQRMSDRSKYQVAEQGDICYNMMRMWQGAVGVAPVNGLISPAYVVAAPRHDVVTRYYAYLFRTDAYMEEVNRRSRGIVSDRNRLYWQDFKQLPCLIPPADEQERIARYLDDKNRRVNRLIRTKQRLIELLNEQKQAIIQRAVTRGLDPDAKTKPSGGDWFGEVPAHWDIIPFKYLVNRVQNGATPPSGDASYYGDDGTPWYGPSAISDEVEVGEPSRRLNDRAFREGKARKVIPPAILVVVIGTTGKTALMREEGATNQQITACRINQHQINPEFCLHQLRLTEPFFRASASSATIPILDIDIVLRTAVAVPPKHEQEEILKDVHSEIDPLLESIDKARTEIDLIREYRTRLIADVVAGKLDVRDVEVPDVSAVDAAQEAESESELAEAMA